MYHTESMFLVKLSIMLFFFKIAIMYIQNHYFWLWWVDVSHRITRLCRQDEPKWSQDTLKMLPRSLQDASKVCFGSQNGAQTPPRWPQDLSKRHPGLILVGFWFFVYFLGHNKKNISWYIYVCIYIPQNSLHFRVFRPEKHFRVFRSENSLHFRVSRPENFWVFRPENSHTSGFSDPKLVYTSGFSDPKIVYIGLKRWKHGEIPLRQPLLGEDNFWFLV